MHVYNYSSNISTVDMSNGTFWNNQSNASLVGILIYLSMALFFILLLNGRVLFLILTCSRLEEPQYKMIGAYCLADILLCLSVCPYMMYNILDKLLPYYFPQPNYIACTVQGTFAVTCIGVCMCQLAALSHERYRYFCQPFLSNQQDGQTSLKRFWISQAICWALPIGFSVTFSALKHKQYQHNDVYLTCANAAGVLPFVCIFVIPSLLIIIHSIVRIRCLIHHLHATTGRLLLAQNSIELSVNASSDILNDSHRGR